jgi:hypothetical protein
VGKTALTARFELDLFTGECDAPLQGRFSFNHSSRRFSNLVLYGIDTCMKQVVVDDKVALIDIFDMSGQEAYA